jgi:hypothetical protein
MPKDLRHRKICPTIILPPVWSYWLGEASYRRGILIATLGRVKALKAPGRLLNLMCARMTSCR